MEFDVCFKNIQAGTSEWLNGMKQRLKRKSGSRVFNINNWYR
jgi:hypothetical protein